MSPPAPVRVETRSVISMNDADTIEAFSLAIPTTKDVPGADEIERASLPASTEREHSPTGPSSADLVFRCPGSVRVRAAAPDDGSEAADRGERLHAATLGLVATGDLASGLDPDDADAATWAAGRILEDRIEAPEAFAFSEDRLDLRTVGAGWGFPDHAWIQPGVRAVLHELKFGARAVRHPRHNWQTILYAVGLVEAFGVQQVECIILRPAADEVWREMRQTWTATELGDLGRAYAQAAQIAVQPKASLCVGSHCDECWRGRAICPALRSTAVMLPRHASFSAWLETQTPEQLRCLLDRIRLMHGVLGGLRDAIETGALAGRWMPAGYEIAEKTKHRAWKDEPQAETQLTDLAKTLGKDQSRLRESSLVSPAQAERVLGSKAKDLIASLTHRPPGEKTIKEATP